MQPIFVGDVHGCVRELDALIARARAAFGDRFRLVLAGDLVNRGPASLRVLERVRALEARGRARCVLGNHEVALLRTAFGQRPLAPGDTFGDVLESPDLDDHVEWLRRLPLALFEPLGAAGERTAVTVHAGLHPDWTLADVRARGDAVARRLAGPRRAEAEALLAADPDRDEDLRALVRMVTCRSVDDRGGASSAEPGEGRVPWHAAWAERRHDYGVVYGHWSLQGLHVAPGLRGLDTGCVHHGRGRDGYLTAWVPAAPDGDAGTGSDRGAPSDPFGVPDTRFWQERARARYVALAQVHRVQ